MSNLKSTPSNPFSVNDPKLLRYYNSIELIDKDISKLIQELKRKTDALIEVQKNHKRSYEENVERLKATCTHANEDGKPATNSVYRDRLEWKGVSRFVKISQCDICGKTFENGSVEIDSEKLKTKGREMMMTEWENMDDSDEFESNLDFNVNNPISVIEKGEAIPIFKVQTAREEITAEDGTVLGVRFVKKKVLNIN
jgi:hypothetical protein